LIQLTIIHSLDFGNITLSSKTRIEKFDEIFPGLMNNAKGSGHTWSGLVIVENSYKTFDYSKWFLFFKTGKLRYVEYYVPDIN
jgi:hypothetical protein